MAKKATVSPVISVVAAHIGYKQAYNNSTLLPTGVITGTTGSGSPYYKFRVGYRVYDPGVEDKALGQFADVIVWGKRYEWLANNIKQYDKLFISGQPKITAYLTNNNSEARVAINIDAHTVDLMMGNSDGAQHTSSQAPPQAQQAQAQPQVQQNYQAPQQQAPQVQQNYQAPQQNSSPANNDDLPF